VRWYLLAMFASCKGDEPTIRVDDVTIELLNPTNSDPLFRADTLRLEVYAGGEQVASEEFGVDDGVSLEGLDAYGTVRFELAGLANGQVVSFGRSAPLALYPGAEITAPMLFLPINSALPITRDRPTDERSEHLATRLPDGQILLAGGRDPRGGGLNSQEIYDPSAGTFSPRGNGLEGGLVDPRYDWGGEPGGAGALVVTGGDSTLTGEPTAATSLYQLAGQQFDSLQDMSEARAGHCFRFFSDAAAIAVGGGLDTAELLRLDAPTDLWYWEAFTPSGLDAGGVTGCAAVDSGAVYLQGDAASATGVFDFDDQSQGPNARPEDAFTAIEIASAGDFVPLDGATLVPTSEGAVWIGGGFDPTGGALNETGRTFNVRQRRYAAGPAPAVTRVDGQWADWIETDWVVLGCGSEDADGDTPQTRLELLNVVGGERFPPIDLDRDRPGWRLNVLGDGAILITGGFDTDLAGSAGAALVVPYRAGD